MKETWLTVMRGRQCYGLGPEEETEIAKECFCAGMILGAACAFAFLFLLRALG